MKVRERDTDLFLLVADGAQVSAQISQSRARASMMATAVRIGELICRQVVLPPNC